MFNLTTTSNVKGFLSISISPYGYISCFSINFSTRHLMSNSSCRRSFFTTFEFNILASFTIAFALSMPHPVFREIKEAISSSDILSVKSLDISSTLLSYDCKITGPYSLLKNIKCFIFYYLLNNLTSCPIFQRQPVLVGYSTASSSVRKSHSVLISPSVNLGAVT